MPDETTQVTVPVPAITNEKCGPDEHLAPAPLGGAHSFGDAEAYRAGQSIDDAVYDLWRTFDDIRANIQADTELTGDQQAALIVAASQDLATRLQTVPADVAAGKETGLLARVKQVAGQAAGVLFGGADRVGATSPKDTGATSFTVTKDLAGNWRWLAIASNNFKDRDGEYFPESAHLDYVAYVDETADYPELRLWHVKGSRIGMADFVAYADHFLLTSGTFDKEFEYLAPVMAEREYGVSHGFRYLETDKQGDTYIRYRSFEVSPLPCDKAANPWTAFGTMESIKEVAMLPEAKKQFVLDHLGPERTAALEASLATTGKELEGLGISFKELDTAAPAAPAQAPAATAVLDVAAPAAADPAPVAQAAADPDPKPEGEGEPTGDGGGDAPPPEEGSAELTEAIKALAGLPAQLTAIEGRLAALEEGKGAADHTPAAAAVVGQVRPSQSDATAVGADKQAAIDTIIGDNKATDAPSNPVTPYLEQLGLTPA